jgi:hypothetical protein
MYRGFSSALLESRYDIIQIKRQESLVVMYRGFPGVSSLELAGSLAGAGST